MGGWYEGAGDSLLILYSGVVMRWFALILLLWISPAVAQVQQAGQITPGHIGYWQHNNLLKDGGPALGGPSGTNPTEIGITNTGTPFCITDGPVQPGTGYHQLCLGANTLNGYGLLSYNPYGGAAPLPFDCEINGVFIPNCFGGGGGSTGLTDVTGTFPITVTSPTSTTRNVAVGIANSVNLGVSRPDNTSITIDSNGILSVPPSPVSGCVVGTGTQFQVVVFDPASNCTASTIRDDGGVISATLNTGTVDNVWKIDPSNNLYFMGDTAGDGVGGISLIAIGNFALNGALGSDNVAIGASAGYSTTSQNAIYIGDGAGGGEVGPNTGNRYVIDIGDGAGAASDSVASLIAIGHNAGLSDVPQTGATSGNHTFLGENAGANNTGQADLIGVGTTALSGNTGLNNVIGIGAGALVNNTGSDAIGIGQGAGSANTLSDVVYLGRIGTATHLFINLVSAANCAGQPSKSIIATTGTGVLLQCP